MKYLNVVIAMLVFFVFEMALDFILAYNFQCISNYYLALSVFLLAVLATIYWYVGLYKRVGI